MRSGSLMNCFSYWGERKGGLQNATRADSGVPANELTLQRASYGLICFPFQERPEKLTVSLSKLLKDPSLECSPF